MQECCCDTLASITQPILREASTVFVLFYLQVLRDGVWHLVKPLKGAFTINVGDMAQVLTNDKFFASNHRVLQSKDSDR